MHRGLKAVKAPLEAQENENRATEEKEEAFCSACSKDLKICKVTKSKVLKAFKKENLSAGKEAQLQKCTQKHPKGLEKESCHDKEDVSCQVADCCFDTLKGDVVGDPALPLSSKENLSSSRPVSLGDECYLTPNTDKAEENSACGVSENQRKTPLDFAAVTVAELGITRESFTKPSVGKSPTLLKLRRRSAIGVRGSPENNSLIQFLAQQRSKRQKEAFPQQVSPFQHVKSLKDKTDAFQTPFESLQEAEGEIGSSLLSQVDDASQEGSYFSSDHITEETGSDAVSGLSRKTVSSVEEQSLALFGRSKTPIRGPVAPPPRGEGAQSGSHLPSALRKTPVKQVMDSMKEYSNDAVDRGEGEPLPVSSCAAEILETLQAAERTAKPSSEKPKKKRVTFGEVLSPEIFDKTLPANTPLRRGATPGQQPAVQSDTPRASLTAEPLSQPSFDSDDECVEPPQELVVGAGAAEDLFPLENAEAETDKSDKRETPATKRKQSSTTSEGTDLTISRAPNTENAKDTNTSRKNKCQRQRNATTSAAKKTRKAKYPSYGKRRRKKKVKKSLYGEREMASKKPLLSPIPEMPEVLSSASTPDSPNILFSEDISGNAHQDVLQKLVLKKMRRRSICAVDRSASSKDLDTAEASSSQDAVLQVSGGDLDLESVSDIDHKLSTIVADAKCGLVTSDSFQQGKETAFVQKGKGNGSLLENEQLQDHLLNKAEQLSGLEFLEQQDRSVHEDAQGIQCPERDSVRGSPPRRKSRRSSAIYFPPIEKLEISGDNLPVSSFNVEEVLSVPQLKHDSLEPSRSKGGERRVRRSMRLHKGAETEGLAWVQIPTETQKKPPLLAPAHRIRRTISTPFLSESENGHQRQPNLLQCAAPGKENVDSLPPADGPRKRWRRKSMGVTTPQETRAWAPTWRRSTPNSVYRKDRGNQEHYEEVEILLKNNI